ncbi:hypothetical protein C0966_12315 [Bacillus methanolicus]|uniref:SEC-C metal-binding domain-containing protein n=1 Tax=Bacillus methanolicus TaxID=1471 RepID=UPI0023806DC6|nr:SEC-C metal-binding domain-containing protein [Bacillus methanolicus]MDE3840131.1 hypothetical protein [Bacillus methanolicus]
MNGKVGRNDPCPCGSGKKYKKCHGAKETVSINQILENELLNLQRQIIDFALFHFESEILEDFEFLREMLILSDESEEEFYEFIHTFWFTCFELLDDGETIMKHFISQQLPKIKRPRLQEILRSWADPELVAGKIAAVDENHLVVKDTLRKESFTINLFENMQGYEKGEYVFAILLPYGQNYYSFPSCFNLPKESVAVYEKFVKTEFAVSGYEDEKEFLMDYFLELMNHAPEAANKIEIDAIDWKHDSNRKVAYMFEEDMESIGELRTFIDAGIILWAEFCRRTNKRIQNPSIYVAALQYLLSMILPTRYSLTQKELAKEYGVSANSISARYNEMYDILEDEIDKLLSVSIAGSNAESFPQFTINKHPSAPMLTERVMHEAFQDLADKDFDSIDEINEYLRNKRFEPKKSKKGNVSDREKAQNLLFDAFEIEGPRRYQLAREALKLNPSHPDGYNILAEEAGSFVEAIALYKQGMELGKQELGESFFKENKGHFWGLLETRPYMRAKMNYAQASYELGQLQEAIHHFEELLELNPNDNQGVRYSLFIAYADNNELGKAKKLLDQYEEGTAHGLYNNLLLELLENGFTPLAGKLLKRAQKSNKFVIDYITGKKKLPDYSLPSYGLGSVEEAIIYVQEHLHIWRKIPGISEWLTQSRERVKG